MTQGSRRDPEKRGGRPPCDTVLPLCSFLCPSSSLSFLFLFLYLFLFLPPLSLSGGLGNRRMGNSIYMTRRNCIALRRIAGRRRDKVTQKR